MEIIKSSYKFFRVYLMPLLITVLSYILLNKKTFNIPGVNENHLENVNIALYSGLLIILWLLLELLFNRIYNSLSFVEVCYTTTQDNFINQELKCNFNDDLLEVFVRVELKGNPKILKNQTIKLILPIQVETQLTKSAKSYCVLEDENIVEIDLSKIFNTNKTKRINGDSATFSLIIQKIDEKVGSSIETNFKNKQYRARLQSNNIYLDK